MKTKASGKTFSRRTFLQHTSALALGAPLIVPASALGAGSAVSPSNRITIGFIGTGRQAVYANIPGFLREPDAQVLAVCDVDSWRLENARKQVDAFYSKKPQSGSASSCQAYRDFSELLA